MPHHHSNPIHQFLDRLRIGFDETMSGTHRMLEGDQADTDLPFSFHIDCQSAGLSSYFNFFDPDFLTHEIQGTVHAAGLAEVAELRGELKLRYIREQKIHYTFEFDGDNGQRFRFAGEKREIYPWNIWVSHFRLYGAVTEADTGKPVSTVYATFAFEDLPRYARGFHIGVK